MSEPAYLALLFQTRDEYRANAEKAIAAKEYRKASELLWGVVTQQLKALAATSNVLIRRHGEFFDFLRRLSVELEAGAIYNEFVDLNALHKNFYDETIPPDAFPRFYERAIQYVARLDELIKQRT